MGSTNDIFFPPFRLDLRAERLWRNESLIPLRPKSFAVLRLLVEQPEQVVLKEELFRTVWPDTVVGEEVLKVCIREIRRALGDDAEAPTFIETVPRKGYRFIGQVDSRQEGAGGSAPQASSLQSPVSRLVGREAELAQLHKWLDKAISGERQVVFVTGEPGIGKTALVDAFLIGIRGWGRGTHPHAPQASNLQPPTSGVWLGWGQCVEHHGAGEAYLPILEVLEHLCRQPGGKQILTLLDQHAPMWLAQMPTFLSHAERERLQRELLGATRERMLRELVTLLEILTAETPLVLILEDLHWSDYSTLDVLAALAQQREPAKLLVIGTYRPAEISANGHPLRTVTQALQLHQQCQTLPLTLLSAAVVEEYLLVRFTKEAPKHLSLHQLAQAVYRRTEGNPLFMVSVVEDLIAREAIFHASSWTLNSSSEAIHTSVPETLRQMILQQFDHLTREEQQILEAASLTGIEFSAAVVAAALAIDIATVEECCETLIRRQLFLQRGQERSERGQQQAAHYRFGHALFPQVFSSQLSPTRQHRLHQRVGETKEVTYGDRAGESATELALHFEQGQNWLRATRYFERAAENAAQKHANREAVDHLTRALACLAHLSDTPARTQQELALHLALGAPLIATKGWAAPEVKQTYTHARILCQRIGDPLQLFFALFGLWVFHYTCADLKTACELATEILCLAEHREDRALRMEAHHALGSTLLRQGKFGEARTHLEQSLLLYDREQHRSHALLYGIDDGVASLGYDAWVLWLLGYLDQAQKKTQEMLHLAHDLAYPLSRAWALNSAGWHCHFRREYQAAEEQAEKQIALCREHGFAHLLAAGNILRGWALVAQGHKAEGVSQTQQGLAALQATGALIGRPLYLAALAEAHGTMGQTKEGLATLEEAFAIQNHMGAHFYEAELYRLYGELSLRNGEAETGGIGEKQNQRNGDRKKRRREKEQKGSLIADSPIHRFSVSFPEESFQKAIAVARRQEAKSLELRAVMSLSRLWQYQGKCAEAHRLLSDLCGWFTEGFETTDLREARTLLAELV